MLSPEDVQKVATLARLKLSEEELEQIGHQLGEILDYVAVLDEVDVSEVEPMAHVADVFNAFRADETLGRQILTFVIIISGAACGAF